MLIYTGFHATSRYPSSEAISNRDLATLVAAFVTAIVGLWLGINALNKE
jgi:hypothetical protein